MEKVVIVLSKYFIGVFHCYIYLSYYFSLSLIYNLNEHKSSFFYSRCDPYALPILDNNIYTIYKVYVVMSEIPLIILNSKL